jgi:hypothetical protein
MPLDRDLAAEGLVGKWWSGGVRRVLAYCSSRRMDCESVQ